MLGDRRRAAAAAAVEAIAAGCPLLRQLALTLPQGGGRVGDAALEAALRSVGAKCQHLWLLRIDSSGRTHRPAVAALAHPSFSRLRSLTLWCFSKDGGLADAELETILYGRTALETLALRNCEGLSDGLFPRWCNRGERNEDIRLVEELDQALLSSLGAANTSEAFGIGLSGCPGHGACGSAESFGALGDAMGGLGGLGGAMIATPSARKGGAPYKRYRRLRNMERCPGALALRSVKSFSLCQASGLSDRACDCLAELLHDAQDVYIYGCPLLTEEALRSFRKGCRFLRSGVVVTRDRTLTWTAATSGGVVEKQHHRKSSFYTSGSSGTESN